MLSGFLPHATIFKYWMHISLIVDFGLVKFVFELVHKFSRKIYGKKMQLGGMVFFFFLVGMGESLK